MSGERAIQSGCKGMGMSNGSDLLQVRDSLVTFARRAVGDGLISGTSGNFSVRVGDVMAITPSGVPYEVMDPAEVCMVRVSDGALEAGTRPSSETPMHRAVYAATDAGATVHTHSQFVVALSSVLEVLPAVHYAMATLGGPVRVASYARFGTKQLATVAVVGLEGRTAVILRNHGALTYGATLAEAYQRALTLEWLASVYWYARMLGSPKLLDERQLAEVAEAVRAFRYGEGA